MVCGQTPIRTGSWQKLKGAGPRWQLSVQKNYRIHGFLRHVFVGGLISLIRFDSSTANSGFPMFFPSFLCLMVCFCLFVRLFVLFV